MPCETLSQFLSTFDTLTKKPTRFLSVQDYVKDDVKELIKSIYDFTKSEERRENVIASDALPELIVNEFDEEQIWQEIELQNSAQWNALVEGVAHGMSNESVLQFPVKQQPAETTDADADQINPQTDPPAPNKSKSKKKINNETKPNAISKKKQAKTSVLDDEFFNLNEMEKFLEQEDKREIYNKKGNEDSDEESINLFEDSSEYSDQEDDENDKTIKYNDFFDGSLEQSEDVNETQSDIDEDALDDDGDDEVSDNFTKQQNIPKKNVGFNLADSVLDDDPSSGEGADVQTTPTNLSDHQIRQQRLRQKIYKLEQNNLSEKPWQLKGEVHAGIRPQNSLLEEVVDFDLTARPAPIITEETTMKLEDIIKQRIKDKVWDDVEKKAKPVPESQEFRKTVILDQDKSKVSLAEVYEQEYLKQKRALAGDEDASEQEPEEQKLIKKAIENLFFKLDALSNYHYTPKPAQPEVKIISNIPAISIEEVAPVATSDAALLAPEEVKANSKGDVMSKSERTTTDKKRERRKKKKLQREKQKEKEKKDKLLTKLNPGLGNKYSKDKAAKLLDVTKEFSNTDKMTQLNETKSLKSSKAFFTQLNDDMAHSGKSKMKKNKTVLPAKKYKL